MRHGLVKLIFMDDRDGTGKLSVQAEAEGYSGKASAYFPIDDLKNFAESIAQFPLAADYVHAISSGFGASKDQPEQEHVGIEIRLTNVLTSECRSEWQPDVAATRLRSQRATKLEIVTTYEPLAQCSKDLVALVTGIVREAILEGEMFC